MMLATRVASRTFSTSRCLSSRIGFVGLGNMGNHMARNLLKDGHELCVFDIDKKNTDGLKNEGASVAASAGEASIDADVVVSMLPSSPNVKSAYLGENGILNHINSGALCIDSTTMEPDVSREMQALLARKKRVSFVDAPVSGGVNAAKNAVLTFMVGGSKADFARAKPILEKMGKAIVYCGDIGSGQAVKICNNMLLAISMIGVSEVMNLGMRLGLDEKLLASTLSTSSGRCWSVDTYNPVPGVMPNVPSSNDYKGGFMTKLMTKDLGLAQDAATSTKSAAPLGSLAHQIYRLMCTHGYADKDFSSAFRFLQEDRQ